MCGTGRVRLALVSRYVSTACGWKGTSQLTSTFTAAWSSALSTA